MRNTGFFRRLGNLLLPPSCLRCRALVDQHGALCGDCWGEVGFIVAPFCDLCGVALPYDVGDGAVCGSCSVDAPVYTKARSVLHYNDASRDLVLRLKHGDQLHGVPSYAQWMARVGAAFLQEADLIMPVPLHWTRRVKRRYNQSGLLAKSLARVTHVAYAPDILVRFRRTRTQGKMNKKDRARNVKSAFRVKNPALIKGKTVVLVDDVLTSGATVNECATVLKAHGVGKIYVLTLARVGNALL